MRTEIVVMDMAGTTVADDGRSSTVRLLATGSVSHD